MPTVAPFELAVQVHASDIDELGHVNNVTYLRWIQEVAIAHWESIADAATRAELQTRFDARFAESLQASN